MSFRVKAQFLSRLQGLHDLAAPHLSDLISCGLPSSLLQLLGLLALPHQTCASFASCALALPLPGMAPLLPPSSFSWCHPFSRPFPDHPYSNGSPFRVHICTHTLTRSPFSLCPFHTVFSLQSLSPSHTCISYQLILFSVCPSPPK